MLSAKSLSSIKTIKKYGALSTTKGPSWAEDRKEMADECKQPKWSKVEMKK